jgi:anthranilate synthase/aminodeoxychorismate synthase-like glutamine amidotransferase
MILVIDNYDSFTYNLVQYLEELGERIEVYRNDRISCDDIASRHPEGIVISPGPKTPDEAGISVDVVRRFSGQIPLFGVCLGHQAIARAFGGSIVRAPTLMHGKTSVIEHDGRTIFAGLPRPFEATRYHSLVVDPDSLPDVLEVSARAEGDVIMGLRHRSHRTEGVQFHPESILTPDGKRVLKNFVSGAGHLRATAPPVGRRT